LPEEAHHPLPGICPDHWPATCGPSGNIEALRCGERLRRCSSRRLCAAKGLQHGGEQARLLARDRMTGLPLGALMISPVDPGD
jgi:hypothetical protein